MASTLAFLKGSKGDMKIKVNSIPFVIGRSKVANLVVAHINVSRNHCKIVSENGLWYITDCSSSGTYVNDLLIGKGNCRELSNEDVVRLGPVESNIFWSFHVVISCSEGNNTEGNRLIDNNRIETISAVDGNKSERFVNEIMNQSSNFSICGFSNISKSILTSNENKKEKELDKERENNSVANVNSFKNNDSEETESKKRKLALQLLQQQEEERKILLKRIKILEETQNMTDSNLNKILNNLKKNELETKNLVEKELNVNINQDLESFKNKSFVDLQELSKEFELIKTALSHLKNKNFLLEEKLLAVSFDKTENVQTSNNLLENITDLIETEFQCTICSELFITAVTLTCSHTFCKFCITQWKKKQKTCPICRKKIHNETQSLVIDNYIDKIVEKLDKDVKNHRENIIAERKALVSMKNAKS